MSAPHRVGDLELAQYLEFQRREWTVQRIGSTVMLLIVALGLAGLFGTGPLSSASSRAGDGAIAADYQRFVRHDGRTTLSLTVDGNQATESNEIELWLSTSYLRSVEIQGISPQPKESRGGADRTTFVFGVEGPSASLHVDFSLRPKDIGRYHGRAGVVGGPELSFDQISYP